MTCSLLIALLATGLVIDQAATPPAQGQTEVPARLSSAEISQLRVKAEAGDPTAQFAMGKAYEDGKGVPQSDEQAVEWYRKAAEQGNAPAQNDLGLIYLAGRGVERSKEEALKWSHKAARQKYPAAMFNLGAAYYNGDGVAADIDVVSAYAWFLLAQEAGSESAADAVRRMNADSRSFDTSAAFEKIADMYAQGNDLPKDYGEGVRWYRRAAERGGIRVRTKLAGLLIEGQDYDEGRRLCEEGAKQKYPPAVYCVGLIYQRGLGVIRNPVEAAKWFNRAAELGYTPAMLRLGEMYSKGSGVSLDKISAYAFILLASSKIPEAEQERASLEKEMSSHDVEKGKKKAIQWAKKYQPQNVPLRKREHF
jgi:hypothetical protein